MYAAIRDTEIYFDVDGVGLEITSSGLKQKPVVFLIHGGPGGDHLSYKSSISSLTDVAQLVYFDHRGQGRSRRGDKSTYTLDNNVEDMEALRVYLGLERIVVFGSSYGGVVAQEYALRYPQNVAKLILSVTASNSKFLDRAQEILADRGTKAQQEMGKYLFDATFTSDNQVAEFFKVFKSMYSRKAALNQAVARPNYTIWNHEALNQGFGGFLRDFNVTERLPEIKVPTLVMGGKYDWICAPEFSEEIAQKIPGAELKIFDNSGHALGLDEPELLVSTVREFLCK